jgi:hypothetical protein
MVGDGIVFVKGVSIAKNLVTAPLHTGHLLDMTRRSSAQDVQRHR